MIFFQVMQQEDNQNSEVCLLFLQAYAHQMICFWFIKFQRSQNRVRPPEAGADIATEE